MGLISVLARAIACADPAPAAALYPFVDGKSWGYIDSAGAWKIPAEFENALRFEGGRASVQKGEKWGLIDVQGQ